MSHQLVGAPLVYRGKAHGVLVVQTYDETVRYTAEDVELIDYVSKNVALAIERKSKDRELREYRENLEEKVRESSKELMKRNAKLRREIAKVKRNERIQKVLYNISEAKNNTENLGELLIKIHEQVGTLMEAANFYVAIVKDREKALYQFPYIVDENPEELEDPGELVDLSGGFTHYVLKTEKPLLADKKKVKELADKGAVAFVGKEPQSWLGIPLKIESGEIPGVVVVQSYSDPRAYTRADKNVLSIISTTIAGAVNYKQLEEKKSLLEEKLLESQKLETVGVLAAGVAHEFNNLLSIIIGHAYNGMRTSQGRKEDYKRYQKIEKTGEQAAELVEKLMVFAKKRERGRAVVTDMAKALSEIVMSMKRKAPAGCDTSADVDDDLWLIKIDREELDDIISNIMANAFHAVEGKERSFVRVSAKNFTGRPDRSTLREVSKYVYIKIEDNGHGMDKDVRSQIFNPFFTTREPGKGTGMGLAIVHTIVQEYYGTIEVESKKDRGTVFHIYLPVTSFYS
jgi:signal transduction histidine kinase